MKPVRTINLIYYCNSNLIQNGRITLSGAYHQIKRDAKSNETLSGSSDQVTIMRISLLYTLVNLKEKKNKIHFLNLIYFLNKAIFKQTRLKRAKKQMFFFIVYHAISFKERWYGFGKPQCGDSENQINFCIMNSNNKGKLIGIEFF